MARKVKKDKKGKEGNSSRMEAHEVAPDVVDVAPADVIKVKFTQIVQRGGYQLLNGRSQLQNCVCRRIKALWSTLYCYISLGF